MSRLHDAWCSDPRSELKWTVKAVSSCFFVYINVTYIIMWSLVISIVWIYPLSAVFCMGTGDHVIWNIMMYCMRCLMFVVHCYLQFNIFLWMLNLSKVVKARMQIFESCGVAHQDRRCTMLLCQYYVRTMVDLPRTNCSFCMVLTCAEQGLWQPNAWLVNNSMCLFSQSPSVSPWREDTVSMCDIVMFMVTGPLYRVNNRV